MRVPRAARVFAPAKINLALHVVGRRGDGYHLLDSLVVFADAGDRLTVTCPGSGVFSFGGAFGERLAGDGENLVARVARRFWPDRILDFHLEKELPVSSGIGGGSADAAACFRAASLLCDAGRAGRDRAMPTGELLAALVEIGADVPVCLSSLPARMRGIGDILDPVAGFPVLWAVLVNPGVGLSTPLVFKALREKENPALQPLPERMSAEAVTVWLAAQRNDLEAPAVSAMPVVGQVLAALRGEEGCRLARMSGSGATCFGLFDTEAGATTAATRLARGQPEWWVRAARLGGEVDVAPQLTLSTT